MVCQETILGYPGQLGGVEGCPSEVDVRLGCGVAGQIPRGGWLGAADNPAPGSRLTQQPQRSSL